MLSSRHTSAHAESTAHQIYTKTPGRNMIKARSALQENAVYRGPRTVAGKRISAQTPRIAKSAFSAVKPVVTVSRPLVDKTAFPNRKSDHVPLDTPTPQATKLAKLSLLDPPADTPVSIPRPSSARRNLRIPRNLTETNPAPVTPVSQIQAQHWDVSDGEVSIAESSIVNAEVEDYDEIEYMPPKVIGTLLPLGLFISIEMTYMQSSEPQWRPDFDMPDYKTVGKTLLDLAQSYQFDDSTDLFYAADIETQVDVEELWRSSAGTSSPSRCERLQLPDLGQRSPIFLSSSHSDVDL